MKHFKEQKQLQMPQAKQIDRLFKQKALLVIFLTVITILLLIGYGMTVAERVIKVEHEWAGYNEEVIKSARALSEIERYFGYGGFIHNFKNYILRKDPSLVNKIENDLRLIHTAIENYQLGEKQRDIINARDTIIQTVEGYSKKFELAQKLVAEGKSSNEIDQQVQLDDRPAIRAFNTLNVYLLRYSEKHVSSTSETVGQTLSLLTAGILIIPALIIVAIVIVVFIRHNILANASLEEKSKYLQGLFDAAPDAIFIINQQGKILSANPAACKLLGFKCDDLIGMSAEQLMPERFRKNHEKIRNNSFQKPEQRPMNSMLEFFALKRDGSEIPVDISISYVPNSDEMQAITIMRDISERKRFEEQLKHKENILNKAQQITHLGSWEWNVNSGELTWSGEIFNIFGLEIDQFGVTYDKFVACLHPDDREAVVNAVNETVVYDKPYDVQHRIIRPDGEIRFVHERGDVYRNENGEAEFMIGTVYDITEQKQAEDAMMLADNVFSHTSEAILVTDLNNRILRVNEAFTKITGYSEAEVVGKGPQILKSGKHNLDFYAKLWRDVFSDGSWQGEIIDRRKDGELFPSWHNISTVQDSEGRHVHYISIFRDITEEKAADERIRNLAQYDQLTQLPNRMLFLDRLGHAINRAKRNKLSMALIFIDLDGFKAVNDQFGHHAGDKLLREVARRLKSCVREEDTIARLGGDEFTIILENMAYSEDAALIANKLIRSLSKEIELDQGLAKIGASIGISIFPEDGINSDLLIKRADMAMYVAKNNGKNQYQYYTAEMGSSSD